MATNNYKLNHAALTDIGLKRKLNEDAIGFIELEHGYVFVICDGMGGHEGGEIASKNAVRFIIESLTSNVIENLTISLNNALIFANQQIFLTAQNRPELKGMGTTAAVLIFFKNEIFTAHAGDSRIYVFSDDRLLQLTKDHSVVQGMVDSGILKAEEAESHPRKNEITKALGIHEQIIPSVNNKTFQAKKGDRFLICSDGLSGLVSNEELKSILRSEKSPDRLAAKLINMAKIAGGDDNISVQIVDVEQSNFSKSSYILPERIIGKKKTKSKKKLIIGLISGIIILSLAGIGFAFLLDDTSNKKLNPIDPEQRDTLRVNSDSSNDVPPGPLSGDFGSGSNSVKLSQKQKDKSRVNTETISKSAVKGSSVVSNKKNPKKLDKKSFKDENKQGKINSNISSQKSDSTKSSPK